MPSKFAWRRSATQNASTIGGPGSVHLEQDNLSRQQRQLETPIYAPAGIYYQVPPVAVVPPLSSSLHDSYINADSNAADTFSEETSVVPDNEAADKSNGPVRTYKKKEQQFRGWDEKTIPEMLGPYITLLRETNSLRDLSLARNNKICAGCEGVASIEVLCVFFESM